MPDASTACVCERVCLHVGMRTYALFLCSAVILARYTPRPGVLTAQIRAYAHNDTAIRHKRTPRIAQWSDDCSPQQALAALIHRHSYTTHRTYMYTADAPLTSCPASLRAEVAYAPFHHANPRAVPCRQPSSCHDCMLSTRLTCN